MDNTILLGILLGITATVLTVVWCEIFTQSKINWAFVIEWTILLSGAISLWWAILYMFYNLISISFGG